MPGSNGKTEVPGEGSRSQGSPSWAIVAPVFDSRRHRRGLWAEISCPAQEAPGVIELLQGYLDRTSTDWLFLVNPEASLTPLLPLQASCEHVVILPDENLADTLPPPLLAGRRGCHEDLESDTAIAWHVVTDPAGPVESGAQALADGMPGWQECQALVDFGWEAFLITGNRRTGQKQPKADQIALSRLLALVTNDADIDELEALFKGQPRLAFDLLTLVNSPALNLGTPATNFRHAITLLGRRQLKRWLQLLMFTRQTSKGEVNILLWHSAIRGHFMELLAARLEWSAEDKDQAFMVGLFSLLDVLLDDSLESLLAPLALPEAVSNALIKHQGPLGQLLRLAVAIEGREQSLVSGLAQTLNVNATLLLEIQLESLSWVELLTTPSGT